MDFDELPAFARFMFMALMKVALTAKQNGLDEKEYLEFCKGCW